MPETMREMMMKVMTHLGFDLTDIHDCDQDDHEGDDTSEDGCEDDGKGDDTPWFSPRPTEQVGPPLLAESEQ